MRGFFGKKSLEYFIATKMVKKLDIVMLPRISEYRRDFDETKHMSYDKGWGIARKILLWDKVTKVIKKGFDSEPLYNNKYLKTKIKS